jgi:hypothetical protein
MRRTLFVSEMTLRHWRAAAPHSAAASRLTCPATCDFHRRQSRSAAPAVAAIARSKHIIDWPPNILIIQYQNNAETSSQRRTCENHSTTLRISIVHCRSFSSRTMPGPCQLTTGTERPVGGQQVISRRAELRSRHAIEPRSPRGFSSWQNHPSVRDASTPSRPARAASTGTRRRPRTATACRTSRRGRRPGSREPGGAVTRCPRHR